MVLVLVDRKAWADGRDLDQHAARLAEIDRAEVEPFDHLGRALPGRRDTLAPGLLIGRLRGERHMMHRARALAGGPWRRRVVGVEARALLSAHLPATAVLAAAE